MLKKAVWILVVVTSLALAIFVAKSYFAPEAELSNRGSDQKLIIYTYPTFMGPFGPGPEIKRLFELENKVQVQFVNAGDGGVLVQRLKMGVKPLADVVVGLDQFTKHMAEKEIQWQPTRDIPAGGIPWREEIKDSVTSFFVPYDWSLMTFIYRQDEMSPPQKLTDLKSPELSRTYTLQDPRSSSPGLQFLFWLFMSGESPSAIDYYKNAHSVSPSWSTSYGLFHKGQAQMGFSYLTSLIYHWKDENNKKYKAVSFPNGHPRQIEFAGIPHNCKNCQLAQKFLEFILKPHQQKILAERNFMWPVIKGAKLDPLYDELPKLSISRGESAKQGEFQSQKESLLNQLEKSGLLK